MNLKKVIRKTGQSIAAFLAVCLLSLTVLFGLCQTNSGKQGLARLLTEILRSDGADHVEIKGITGLVPFDFQIESITLRGPQGAPHTDNAQSASPVSPPVSQLLLMEGISCRWRPLSLFKGILQIEKCEIKQVQWVPGGTDKIKPKTESSVPFSWLPYLKRLRVDRLSVDRLSLGKPSCFKVQGKFMGVGISGDRSSFLRVDRVDPGTGNIFLEVTIREKEEVFSVVFDVEEDEKGLIPMLSEIHQPVSLSLHGDGTFQKWHGILQAGISKIGSLEANIGLTISESPKITARGLLCAEPDLMPSQFLTAFGNEVRFELESGVIKPEMLSIDLLTLAAGTTRMQLSAQIDARMEITDGRFTFECKNSNVIKTLSVHGAAENLLAEGRFSGPLFLPRVALTLDAVGLEVDRVKASKLAGSFDLRFQDDPEAAFPAMDINGSGSIEDLCFQDTEKPPQVFPEKILKWKFDVEVPAHRTVQIHQFELAGQNLNLNVTGQTALTGLDGTFDVLLDIRDTQGFSDLLGFELPGPLHFEAKIQGEAQTRLLASHVQGKINITSQRYQSAIPLLGEKIDCTGDLTLMNEALLKVSGLRLKTATGALNVDGSLDFLTGNLDGSWRFLMPDLAAIATPLNRDFSGLLNGDGTFHGTLDKMGLTFNVGIKDFSFEGHPFNQAKTKGTVKQTAKGWDGNLSVRVLQENKDARIQTDFSLKGQALTFSSFSMQAVGSRTRGNMTLFLDRQLLEGKLHTDCEDLSVAASLFNENMHGSIGLKTDFRINQGKQHVLFVIDGKDLAYDIDRVNVISSGDISSGNLNMGRLNLSGKLTKLAQTPEVNASLNIETLSYDNFSLSHLTLKTQANTHQATFSGKTNGTDPCDFEIASSGKILKSQQDVTLSLEQLVGQINGSRLDLNGPVQIKQTGQGWKLEPLELQLDAGRLQAHGSLLDKNIDANIKFDSFPLAILQFLDIQELNGIAGGDIFLTGSLSQPEGRITVRVDDMGLGDEKDHVLQTHVLETNATIKNNTFLADLRLKGPAVKSLDAQIEMPVKFSLEPFEILIPSRQRLRGKLAGNVNLAHTFMFFDLPDHNLEGRLDLDLLLLGTADNPQLKGSIRITDGAYAHLGTGTHFKDADFLISAEQSKLAIERGVMRDGAGGVVSFKGWANLAPEQKFPFQVEATLDKVVLIRQDYATATAGGKLSFSGSLAEALFAGQLDILSAEFQIPDRLPQDVTELSVIEINSAFEEPVKVKSAPAPEKHLVNLNVSVQSPGRVFIRGRGLDSEWNGNFQVTGTAYKPMIAGRLTVVRGFFNFMGKRFALKDGRVNFFGAFPPSPSINVMAEYNRTDLTARLKLSGSMTAPALELSSDPSMPKDEILSHILFGRNVSDITPVQALQLAQAINSLTSKSSFDLLGRTRKFLGVDQLEIKQSENGSSENNSSQAGVEGTSISVGKYLHERVYITTEKGLQDESGKVAVEIELTPKITVETEVKENAEGGVGLKWKWNY